MFSGDINSRGGRVETRKAGLPSRVFAFETLAWRSMDRSASALKKLGKIRVGLIGDGGRAVARHAAALDFLPDYQLIGVASNSRPVLAGADEFHDAFDAATEVVRHPEVDLVAITGGAPLAYYVASEAMLAGKDVYSDWPIDMVAGSAETLSVLAERTGARHFVGLELRLLPAIRYMRDLLASGHCGRVRSLRLSASPSLVPTQVADDDTAGPTADMPMHFLDAAFSLTGWPRYLSGLVGSRSDLASWPHLSEWAQLCVMGVLENDAMFSIHCEAEAGSKASFVLEISGDEGKLKLSAATEAFADASLTGRSRSSGDLVPLDIPKTYQWFYGSSLPANAVGVANLYAGIVRDLHEGTHLVPEVRDGLLMNRVFDLARRSSELGHRVNLEG